ncbi:MAG: HAD-IA family hydrolase [Venatoribacter sp.]
MPRFKLVVFDWDGTLVDSTGRIVDSMQRASAYVGLPAVSDGDVQNIIGLGLPEAIQTLWPDISEHDLHKITPIYARYFVDDSPVGMGPFVGAIDLLENLLERGHLLAVATGKTRRGLDRMFRDLKLGHYFAASRCADETCSKPDPLMLNEVLNELSIDPADAVMIGDTTYDLMMAQAAGVASIAMSHGAHEQDRLLSCNPLTLCHSMRELNEWLKNNG